MVQAATKTKPKKEKKTETADRFEIRLSGSGGQGLILAGVLLAQAIGRDPKRNVVQTQSYGPEARGGASRADVVISGGEIYYPKTMKLDLLLALTQEACDKFYGDLKDKGLLIVDSNLVTQIPTHNYYAFPFVRLAREEAGHPMVANVIALAAITELTGIVDQDAMRAVVRARAPRGTEEKNMKALEIGFRIAKEAKNK
jgi:2-oxoglutarate ferredoxin oxidoreductase subunit gamma